MNRTTLLLLATLGWPAAGAAQEDPTERLRATLPPEIAEAVLERMSAATSRDLPAVPVADLAREGVAKGHDAGQVLAAVDVLVADMERAREALGGTGRAHIPGDVEAATAALRMGVDGGAVSELARSGPSGRSLAVPLLVLGGLTQRGVPADDALTAVRARLESRANDASLLDAFPEVGRGLSRRLPPEQAESGLARGFGGFGVPVSGVSVPVRSRPGIGGLPLPPGRTGLGGPGR